MRAKEFINEAEGKMTSAHKRASNGGEMRVRDKGGYDRTYHLNRFWMATAMADGMSKKAVDMDNSSFVEKYNIAFPYTDAEHLMVLQAMATIPTDGQELNKRAKSSESEDTYTTSPTPDWNPRNSKKNKK
jgi:hypothetical protein